MKHRALTAFFVGITFGVGLALSGMTLPAKVIGFLDITGAWDPSLAFVMGGAVVVYFFAFKFVTGRERPVFADAFSLPTRRDIDFRLVAGATLFGMGWGLGGFCPGPALTSLPTLKSEVFVFVAAMLGGMWLFTFVDSTIKARQSAAESAALENGMRQSVTTN